MPSQPRITLTSNLTSHASRKSPKPQGTLDAAHGLLLDQGGRRAAEGVTLLEKLSDEGSSDAANLMATLCASGAWTPQNWPLALDYLQRAAERGSRSAQGQLILLAPGDGNWAERRSQIDLNILFRIPDRSPICESPRVRFCEGFLSPIMCDWLIQLAQNKLKPAMMVEGYGAEPSYTTNRTNSDFAFGVLDADCILALVRERISTMVKLPVHAMEPPQMLHYAPGQELKPHVDYLQRSDRSDPGAYQGDRIVTFLLYLNDGFEAGETAFPRADLKAKPAKGGALYFANVDSFGKPDPRSLHAGLPPVGGEKWLLSQWIHDRPYTA